MQRGLRLVSLAGPETAPVHSLLSACSDLTLRAGSASRMSGICPLAEEGMSAMPHALSGHSSFAYNLSAAGAAVADVRILMPDVQKLKAWGFVARVQGDMHSQVCHIHGRPARF